MKRIDDVPRNIQYNEITNPGSESYTHQPTDIIPEFIKHEPQYALLLLPTSQRSHFYLLDPERALDHVQRACTVCLICSFVRFLDRVKRSMSTPTLYPK